MRLSPAALGALLTALSALGFSTQPILGIVAYRAGANVVTVLGFRFLMAAAALWALVLIGRKALPDRKTTLQLLLMGSLWYTTFSVLYMKAVEADRLSPALAALLLYTYPAMVSLLAWRFDGQRIVGHQAVALLLALVGTVLVLVVPGAATIFTPLGAVLALGSAVTYATYVFFGSRVTRRTSPLVATAILITAAAAVFLGYGTATNSLVPMAPPGWWATAAMALFATVLAVLFFFTGIVWLGPARAAIISTLEPVGTAALAALLFGDRLGLWQIAGGALVLFGVVWLQVGTRREEDPKGSEKGGMSLGPPTTTG